MRLKTLRAKDSVNKIINLSDMVWYRKIFGAMDIARGGRGSFLLPSDHLDPDECLVQD
jgi:hypothetical protein